MSTAALLQKKMDQEKVQEEKEEEDQGEKEEEEQKQIDLGSVAVVLDRLSHCVMRADKLIPANRNMLQDESYDELKNIMSEMNAIVKLRILSNDGGVIRQIKELKEDRDGQREEVEKLKQRLSAEANKTVENAREEIEETDDVSLKLKASEMIDTERSLFDDGDESDEQHQEKGDGKLKSSEGSDPFNRKSSQGQNRNIIQPPFPMAMPFFPYNFMMPNGMMPMGPNYFPMPQMMNCQSSETKKRKESQPIPFKSAPKKRKESHPSTNTTATATATAGNDSTINTSQEPVSWEKGLEELKIYRKRNGSCKVPDDEHYKELHSWVQTQRFSLYGLEELSSQDEEHKKILDEINFFAETKMTAKEETNMDKWVKRYYELKAYRDSHNCSTKVSNEEPYIQLYQWSQNQKAKFKDRSGITCPMLLYRIRLLENIGFEFSKKNSAAPEPQSTSLPSVPADSSGITEVSRLRRVPWEKRYEELKAYVESHDGSCNVPNEEPYFQLFSWCRTQRSLLRKKDDDLSPLFQTRKKQLQEFCFFAGDDGKTPDQRREDIWMEQYGELKAFKANEGSCNVPRREPYVTLHKWCNAQRLTYNAGYTHTVPKLHARMEMLREIGFDFSMKKDMEKMWKEKYEELKAYHTKFGTCKVSAKDQEYRKLYEWCIHQRKVFRSERVNKCSVLQRHLKLLKEIDFDFVGRGAYGKRSN